MIDFQSKINNDKDLNIYHVVKNIMKLMELFFNLLKFWIEAIANNMLLSTEAFFTYLNKNFKT